MKKVFTVLTCCLCTLLFLASCDAQLISGKSTQLTEVKFIPNLLSGKSLTVTDSPTIAWLEYQAQPKYSDSSAVISGTVGGDDWKRLTPKDSSGTYSTGAVFTQGYWDFNIQVGEGSDDDSVIYYTGSASCYLTGTSTTITVDMVPEYNTEATGTLSLDITTPTLNSSAGSFKIKVYDSSYTNLVTTFKDGDDSVTFTNYSVDATVKSDAATVKKTYTVVPGIYFMEIQYVSGTASTEKTVVAFKVIEGCESTIEGSLENGAYVSGDFNLQYFSGTLDGPTSGVLEFKPKLTYPGTITYTWFVNGTKQTGTSKTFTFSETAKGSYCVTCVAIHTYNSCQDVCSVSKIIKVE